MGTWVRMIQRRSSDGWFFMRQPNSMPLGLGTSRNPKMFFMKQVSHSGVRVALPVIVYAFKVSCIFDDFPLNISLPQ